jgi:hydroxyacylglutathione hydrolase
MRVLSLLSLLNALLMIGGAVHAGQADDKGVRHGDLPQKWITGGPKCAEAPDGQYNEDPYIIRESACTDAGKPFLYRFFGEGYSSAQTGENAGNRTGQLALRIDF